MIAQLALIEIGLLIGLSILIAGLILAGWLSVMWIVGNWVWKGLRNRL